MQDVYGDMKKYHGFDKAKLYLKSQLEVIKLIINIIKTNDIKCDLKCVDSNHFYKNYQQSISDFKELFKTDVEYFWMNQDVMSLDKTAGVDQKYYLPQDITATGDPSSTTDYTIEVVYTIKTTEASTVTTETVTKYIKASEIYGEKWEINKKYTCTLTFSLNEILWDPAVENWDGVDIPTSGLITI